MIPGSFQYHRPTTVADAVKLLVDLGEDARPLAGGHSLIPMMKLRMATPEHLVDLAAIAELKGIRQQGGTIVIGAMTTQKELIASDLLTSALPVIRETSLLIADPQVRYCGTIGGNVANGDPGNDMPAVMMALDASYQIAGSAGMRAVKAREFYFGAYYTALEPGEVVTAIAIPVPPAGHGSAYEKLKRKIGDYATAAAAVVLTKQGGRIASASITLTNVGQNALLAEDAMAAVRGTALGPDVLARAAAAAEAITDPASDGRGPAAYRTKVAGIMVRRALERAFARAAG